MSLAASSLWNGREISGLGLSDNGRPGQFRSLLRTEIAIKSSGAMNVRHLLLIGCCGAGSVGLAGEQDWFVPLGAPPQAAPRRISGGESFPPLPLPATPLRRTERKREPSPPKLIAKVIWGESASFTYDNGAKAEISDWNLCPADLQQLMRKASGPLGVAYGSENLDLASFEGDPAKHPVLFFSGVRTIKFNAKELDLLRAYVLRGGMIVADSIAGSPFFYDSFKQTIGAAFPEFGWHVIPPDHPIYHVVADVEKVSYPRNLEATTPLLEGIYVHSRIGVLLSKYGLGCGWDDHEVPLIPQAIYYDVDSANKLGLNLAAYVVGYARVGREEAKPELFGGLDEKRPTDEFVFGQIKHEGDWNVHAGGVSALLRRVRENTSLRVSLKRVPVQPGKEDLSSLTFLYLTGLDEFHWDASAVAALKKFLKGGGTLLINNGLGLRTFDLAVRRELKQLLPEAELSAIGPNEPIYHAVFKLDQAKFTAAALAQKPDLQRPYLEGITLNGDLKVIYSPYDLEAGWEGLDHPLARAYAPESAVPLGINIIMYAMTH
jgi:hypothetical protein